MNLERKREISARLHTRFGEAEIEVRDDSALHVGHEGARGGAGHFAVHIVSPDFEGLGRLKRHQMIYQALGDMMPAEIHALSIEALTQTELQQRKS